MPLANVVVDVTLADPEMGGGGQRKKIVAVILIDFSAILLIY